MTFLYSYISSLVSAGGMSVCVLPLQECECCLLFRLKLFFFLPVFILQKRQVHCVTGDINVHGTQWVHLTSILCALLHGFYCLWLGIVMPLPNRLCNGILLLYLTTRISSIRIVALILIKVGTRAG